MADPVAGEVSWGGGADPDRPALPPTDVYVAGNVSDQYGPKLGAAAPTGGSLGQYYGSGRQVQSARWFVPLCIAFLLAIVCVAALLVLTRASDPGRSAEVATAPSVPAAVAPTEPSASEIIGFVERYYALLPRDTATAWQLLGPAAQSVSGSYSGYARFYSGLSSVGFVEGPDYIGFSTVAGQLRFVRADGRIIFDRYEFTVTRSNGELRISSFVRR